MKTGWNKRRLAIGRGIVIGIVLSVIALIAFPSLMAANDNCRSPQKCEEIDEVWSLIGSFVGRSEVWSTVDGWVPFDKLYPRISAAAPGGFPTAAVLGVDCNPSIEPSGRSSNSVGKPSGDAEGQSGGSLENGIEIVPKDYFTILKSDQYGTIELVNTLEYTACYLHRKYGAKLVIKDLSKEGGGPHGVLTGGEWVGHLSHQSGRDADIGFYVYENGKVANQLAKMCEEAEGDNYCQPGSVFEKFKNGNAIIANLDFLKVLTETYDIQYIFIDPELKKILKEYGQKNGLWQGSYDVIMDDRLLPKFHAHHTHYHIRIKCPQGDSCADNSPVASEVRPVPPISVGSPTAGGAGAVTLDLGALDACRSSTPPVNLHETSGQTVQKWMNALSRQAITGTTIFFKSPHNGPSDGLSRLGNIVGRDTLIFIPCSTELTRPLEIVYYFHGLKGFGGHTAADCSSEPEFNDFESRLAPQAREMAVQARNFILVVPELPWSAGDGKCESMAERNEGQSSKVGTVNFKELHDEVLEKIKIEKVLSSLPVSFVSMTGHSAGGAALKHAASSGQMNTIGVNKVTLSDGDYYGAAQAIWDNYIEGHPEVEYNIVVQKPSNNPVTDEAKASCKSSQPEGWCDSMQYSRNIPTEYAVRFLAENSFIPSPLDAEGIIDWINVPQHIPPNINYLPLSQGHLAIGALSLKWESGQEPSASRIPRIA